MPRARRFHRTRTNLPEQLHERLKTYALAAGAAGVSLLALTQPSEAEIVYTPVDVVISRGGSYNLDLNNDGIVDFTIVEHRGRSEFLTGQWLTVKPEAGNLVKCLTSSCVSSFIAPAALYRGSRIGVPGQRGWLRSTGSMAFEEESKSGFVNYDGPWANVTDRFLGLRFLINREEHFGWARLSVIFHAGPDVRTWWVHLTGFAYETVVNKPIRAGQFQDDDGDALARPQSTSPGDATPTSVVRKPVSGHLQFAILGALALGSDGIPLWRREESESDGKSRDN